EASRFFSRLRSILVWIGVNDGNMEEGSLRCDANVSVRPSGDGALGTKAEIKNLNSFRFLQRALEYEIDRQIDVLTGGGRIVQETRLWDAGAGMTASMRSKEEAHDYRYFPEPDLPPLVVDTGRIGAIRSAMPELPEARRARLVEQYGLPEYDAGQLTESRALVDYFEEGVGAGAAAKAASNWIMGELARALKDTGRDITSSPVSSASLARLVSLVDAGRISGSLAKAVFETMVASGRAPEDIVGAEGLAQIDDEAQIMALIAPVLAAHAGPVAQYREGKTAAFGFLVGQVMKASAGKANPRLVNELLRRALEA
ncbi:MAG TPA: Asp-tRNA(Asn)/Glu-tRNA(Gln) amidotransferase subunit GatB, partial [Usitatibacter sp.]